MSEQGWRDFLATEGLDDWVVMYGGATAVFRTASLADAGRLAEAITAIPGMDRAGTLVTIAGDRLTVRLAGGVYQLEAEHVGLARAASEAARTQGATADRGSVQEVQLAVAARPADLDVGFWRAVLGYDDLDVDNGVDPLGQGSTFWMQELDPTKPLRHAMHVDVSVAREHASARLAAALEAGGRVVDESHAPAYWILADRAGNKVCIAAWPDGSPHPTSLVE